MFYGKWITAAELRDNLHCVFEKRIEVGDFSEARIRITADDYYKLYINGKLVGTGPAPSYSFNYNFNEFDVTEYLTDGENALTVHCCYQGLTNRVWVSGDNIFGMIADIYVDGKLFCSTDSSWDYKIDNTFTGGDTVGYDTAFLENRDMTAGQSAPKKALERPCPHAFAADPVPALEFYEVTAKPVKSGNRYFYDFGREYVCTPIIKASAKTDGISFTLRCGEELNDNGSVRCDMRCGCRYEEKCTLKSGKNTVEQYDYKAFRYIEIIADDGVKIDDVRLLARHYPFPDDAQEIETENEKLRAVFGLCRDTIKYGTQEVYIDCPTREKGQYLGDVFISGFAHFYLTKDSRLLKKALFDFAGSIKYSGEFLSVAPCAYRQKIADYDLLYPTMLLKYYNLTGDGETLKALAPICDFILGEYEEFANESGLLENVTLAWNLVDWPAEARDGYEYNLAHEGETGLHSVINAYYIGAVKSAQIINALLGRAKADKTEQLIRAFDEAFFNSETGLYVDCKGSAHSSLHANALPLALGICSDGKAQKIADYLTERGMACSVYMAYFYLTALCKAGRKDAALAAITSDDEHGWLNMLSEGATSTFEAWGKEQKWNTSLFHPWATSPILILNEYFTHDEI